MPTTLFPYALDETLAAVQTMASALGRELAATSLARDEAGDLLERDEIALQDAGLFALLTAEEHGGAGLGLDALVVALEALAAHDPSVALVAWAQNVCGADAQQERVAVAWGEGCFVGGRAARPLIEGAEGSPEPVTIPLEAYDSLGFRGAGWSRVPSTEGRSSTTPDDSPLPAGAIAGLIAVAAGIARGAHEAALAYAKERKQFKRPIADFQAIQWMLADGATSADALSLLARSAAARASGVAPGGEHATRPTPASTSVTPVTPVTAARQRAGHELRFAARRCQCVADAAVQIHGGAGYTTEYPVARLLRDASALTRVPRLRV